MTNTKAVSENINARQQAIVPIAANAVAGDIPKLGVALDNGLDAGLTVNEVKEVLIQLYAYAGFPRSLNALGELLKVVNARKQRGIQDAQGLAPSHAIPQGDALRAAGTVNQTKLSGGPVKGPLFDFAPAIGEYLQTHLFGDIFERDNLDWQSRELATISMLSVLPGAESQLQSHVGMGMNAGLTANQIRRVADALSNNGNADRADRVREALARHLVAI